MLIVDGGSGGDSQHWVASLCVVMAFCSMMDQCVTVSS